MKLVKLFFVIKVRFQQCDFPPRTKMTCGVIPLWIKVLVENIHHDDKSFGISCIQIHHTRILENQKIHARPHQSQ